MEENKVLETNEIKASPGLQIFFLRLLDYKEDMKAIIDLTDGPEKRLLLFFYKKLDKIMKDQEEK